MTVAVIATPYALPYRVDIQTPPLMSGGRSAVLKVTPVGQLDSETAADLESVTTAFALLASTGALAGMAGPPGRAADFEWSKGLTNGGDLQWEFVNCSFDERAAVILAQMFLLSQPTHPISRLAVAVPGGRTSPLSYDRRLLDPYPPVWQPTPFSVRIDPDIFDVATLRVDFVRPPTADEQAQIDGQIVTWAVATAMGAYGVAPVPPNECSAQFEPAATFFERELEFELTRLRAHRASLYGLVNVCIAVHQTVLAVSALSIE